MNEQKYELAREDTKRKMGKKVIAESNNECMSFHSGSFSLFGNDTKVVWEIGGVWHHSTSGIEMISLNRTLDPMVIFLAKTIRLNNTYLSLEWGLTWVFQKCPIWAVKTVEAVFSYFCPIYSFLVSIKKISTFVRH